MSLRSLNKPITVPKGVQVEIGLDSIRATGPMGNASCPIYPIVKVLLSDGMIFVSQKEYTGSRLPACRVKFIRSILGTTYSLISNLMQGVGFGYKKDLLLVGVGYRAKLEGSVLNLSLGYSHPVVVNIPDDLTVEVPSLTEITVKGADKQMVGQFAANLYRKRPVEPYKGKGFRYKDVPVVMKDKKK